MRSGILPLLAVTLVTCGQVTPDIGDPFTGDLDDPMADGTPPAGGEVAPAAFPLDCAYVFDAADIDGDETHNSAYSNGDPVGTWVNKGTTTGNATVAAPRRPHYLASGRGGHGALEFGGIGSILEIASSAAGTKFIHGGDFEIVAVYRYDSLRLNYWLASTNSNLQVGSIFAHGFGTTKNSVWIDLANGAAAVVNERTTFTIAPGEFASLDVYGDGASLSASKDWSTYEVTAYSAAASTADQTSATAIGHYSASLTTDGFDGEISFLALCSGDLSVEDRALVKAWKETRYGVDTSARDATTTIALIGDSITETAITRAEYSWTSQIEAQRPGVATAMLGNGGDTILQCQTMWTTFADNRGYDALFLLCGINSIAAGVAGATVFTTWEAIVDAAIADGMAVVGATLLPFGNYSGWTAGRQTELEALNTAIRAKSGITVLDLYALYGDSGDAKDLRAECDVGDGLHLGPTCQAELAEDVATAVLGPLSLRGLP